MCTAVAVVFAGLALAVEASTPPYDPRDLLQGRVMVADGYLDQPYCTILDSGRWICTVTANALPEGSAGEHVAVFWSDDRGATWQPQVSVEPSPVNLELDNAYSMIIASTASIGAGGGQRVYVIYNMNVDNVTSFPNGQHISRVDMMGKFQMRYSDDEGATWSAQRYDVPYRLTPIDYANDWKGNTTIMWTVDQLKVRDGVAYFAFTKIGKYMLGPPEEMWIMASPNILTEPNASLIEWTLLPHGEHGVKPIAGFENTNIEEAHVVPLKDVGYPGLYMVGRTTMGYLVSSSAEDGNATTGLRNASRAQFWNPDTSTTSWIHSSGNSDPTCRGVLTPLEESSGAFRTNAGLKNPRGPITMRRLKRAPGSVPRTVAQWVPPCTGDVPQGAPEEVHPYLLLFYNNHELSYLSRDPYWLSVGWEVRDGEGGNSGNNTPSILWSQPEVVLYDRLDHTDRPGYPDFVQDFGPNGTAAEGSWTVYITETQKTTARLHAVDDALIQGLLRQHFADEFPVTSLFNFSAGEKPINEPAFPVFSNFSAPSDGFAVAFAMDGQTATEDQVLLTTISSSGDGGIEVVRNASGSVVLTLNSATDTGATRTLATDPVCTEAINAPGHHVVSINVDAAPLLVTFVVDGVLCDGGGFNTYGWGWVPSTLGSIKGSGSLVFGESGFAHGALWLRPLTTSEQVALQRNWRQASASK